MPSMDEAATVAVAVALALALALALAGVGSLLALCGCARLGFVIMHAKQMQM